MQQLDSLIPQHPLQLRPVHQPESRGKRAPDTFLPRLKLLGTSHFELLVSPERGLPRKLKPRRKGTEETTESVGGQSAVWLIAEAFRVVLGGEKEGSIKGYSAPRLWMAFVAPGQSLLQSFAWLALP